MLTAEPVYRVFYVLQGDRPGQNFCFRIVLPDGSATSCSEGFTCSGIVLGLLLLPVTNQASDLLNRLWLFSIPAFIQRSLKMFKRAA